MHTGTLLTAYMATSAVASVLKLTNGPCGVEPSWEQIEAAHEMRQQESEARKTMGLSNAAQTVAVTTVPIYAHVVASSKSSSGYLDVSLCEYTACVFICLLISPMFTGDFNQVSNRSG